MRQYRTISKGIILLAAMVILGDQQRVTNPQHVILAGPASHGLRAYIDPDTGEYARQPELAPQNNLQTLFSASAYIAQPIASPLIEVGSAKAGGGFSIDLQERFRPTRHKPDA